MEHQEKMWERPYGWYGSTADKDTSHQQQVTLLRKSAAVVETWMQYFACTKQHYDPCADTCLKKSTYSIESRKKVYVYCVLMFSVSCRTFIRTCQTQWQLCAKHRRHTVAGQFVEEILSSRLFQSHGHRAWRTDLTPRKKNGHLWCIH